jgi:hypothetical protein
MRNRALCGQPMDDDATIIKCSDLLCDKLVQRERNTIRPIKHQEITGEEPLLTRICIDGKNH